jgi:hypothetical protein
LPDGIDIQQLFLCAPMMLLHDFPLQHRQHGQSAAESKSADLKETDVQIEYFFGFHDFYISFLFDTFLNPALRLDLRESILFRS